MYKRLEFFIFYIALFFFLFFSLSLIHVYPWERIGSTYLLPTVDLIKTGNLMFQYQLYYSDTDRLLANPPLYYLVLAPVVKLLGAGIQQVRLLSIVINGAILTGIFLLVRKLFSKREAMLSVFILALSDTFFSLNFNPRPTHLSAMFFVFSILCCVIGLKQSKRSFGMVFLSGLLMGLSILSHFYILTYGIILLLTILFFSKKPCNFRFVAMHAIIIFAGIVLPLFSYMLWLGNDIPEWWHVQKILAGSDATNNRNLSLSFGIWQFIKENFLHWNFEFTYEPHKLLAVHRYKLWLGFPWGWLYAISWLYIGIRILYNKARKTGQNLSGDKWLLTSLLFLILIPGIIFPTGGNEYLLPIIILFSISVAIVFSDLLFCDLKSKFRHIFLCIGLIGILLISSLRFYYNINVFNDVMKEPSYDYYIQELSKNFRGKKITTVVGPHLIAAGLINYGYFDYYALHDFYAFSDRHRLRGDNHPVKVKFDIALCERLLKDSNLLITNDWIMKPRSRRVVPLLVKSGFYKESGRAESKYYKTTTAYFRSEDYAVPFVKEIDAQGNLMISFVDGMPHVVKGLFVRHDIKEKGSVDILLSFDDKSFKKIRPEPYEIILTENGFLWAPEALPAVRKIKITSIGSDLYIALSSLALKSSIISE